MSYKDTNKNLVGQPIFKQLIDFKGLIRRFLLFFILVG